MKKSKIIICIMMCICSVCSASAVDMDSIYSEIVKIYSYDPDVYENYKANKNLGNSDEVLFSLYNLWGEKLDFNKKVNICQVAIGSIYPVTHPLILIIADGNVKIFKQCTTYTRNILREVYELKQKYPEEIGDDKMVKILEKVIYPNLGYEYTRMRLNKIILKSGSFEYYFNPSTDKELWY